MTTDVILWLLTTVIALGGGGLAAYIALIRSLSDLRERVKVVEVVIATFGEQFAKALHSPHDPYGIDPLLDKYLDRKYELTWDEWEELLERTDKIASEEGETKEHRLMAGMLHAVCKHKLHQPPQTRKPKS